MTAAAVLLAIGGCALSPDEESTTTEDLSVLNWSTDTPGISPGHDAATNAGIGAAATTSGLVYAVWPAHDVDRPWYLRYSTVANTQDPTELVPAATSTSRPTLVPFNGFLYLFYASDVDQYMARFDPATHRWTGSTRLPFNSLGAVAAVPYNGSLTIVRVEPSNHQLMMMTMSTTEAFSPEQPVTYNTTASDPCSPVIIVGVPGVPLATTSAISIGFWVNDTTTSTPALAAAGSCLYMAHLDNTTNTLVYNNFKNGSWGPRRTITSGLNGAAQTSSVQPAMAYFNSVLHLVHLGPGSTYGDILWTTFGGGTWSAPLTVPNHQSAGTPTLATAIGRLWMLHQGHYAGDSNVWRSSWTP